MSDRLCYLECGSGISGDMVVGALLDLGASQTLLVEALDSLPLDGFRVSITRKTVRGIDACDFDVILDEGLDNHDHDMAYLFGEMTFDDASDHHDHDHGHGHDHVHGHDHEHDEAHHHAHHHEHAHAHRGLNDVLEVISHASLSSGARSRATSIFETLARAEAKAHGTTPDKVHFHEVGAVDSIVDVVAAAVCLDDLGFDELVVSTLVEGTGEVRCAHGMLPIPVPAVANILMESGIPIRQTDRHAELVTPTGAAIAAAMRTRDCLPQDLVLKGVGVGSGKRDYDPPSILRAFAYEPANRHMASEELMWKLETDIDDCTAECLGYTLDLLMARGAREAHALPLTMKGSRPGTQIQVICDEAHREELERVIFENTTSIGIRRVGMERTVLVREMVEAQTAAGAITGKRVALPSGESRTYPEHRSVLAACERSGRPYQEVYRIAIAAFDDLDSR